MSLLLLKKVWEDDQTSGSNRLVLLTLADMANKDGICWPGFATIARRCNIDRRTAIKAVGWLEKHGYLIITHRPVAGSKHQSNMYIVQVPDRNGNASGEEDPGDGEGEPPVVSDHQEGTNLRPYAEASSSQERTTLIPWVVTSWHHNPDRLTPDSDRLTPSSDPTPPKVVAQNHPGSGVAPPESLINHHINLQGITIEPPPTTTTSSLEEEEEENSSGIDIFKLYEENFGRLTPLIKGALVQAKLTYPEEWIRDAMIVAVKQNNHRWRYIEGVLKNWHMYGKTE